MAGFAAEMLPSFAGAEIMETKTYTVNVPDYFPDVSSGGAARMIEFVFERCASLAPDVIGSGPKVLRLTVDEGQAETLRELSGGASMAASFRRLFSTIADVCPARRLASGPPLLLGVRSQSGLSLLPEVSRKTDAPVRLQECPYWFDLDSSNRISNWQSLGRDCQLRMIEAHESKSVSAPAGGEVQRKASFGETLVMLLPLLAVWIVLFAVLFLARTKPGGSAVSSGPRFGCWLPQ